MPTTTIEHDDVRTRIVERRWWTTITVERFLYRGDPENEGWCVISKRRIWGRR